MLLLKSKTAYEGAKNGLLLWAEVIVPTLLPFMVCSNVIVSLDAIHLLTFPFRRLLRSVLKLSDAGCYVLVSGLLCGYPMGAKTCNEFLTDKKIIKKEGQYLLSICNHPSPMFLLGYVALRLPAAVPLAVFLIAVYLPTLVIAWSARRFYGITAPSPSLSPDKEVVLSFDENLMNSFDVIIKIGGYMMMFSILAIYIRHLPLGGTKLKAMFLGLIEITTGIQSLALTGADLGTALCILFSVVFGSFSGIFQTKSVLVNKHLSIVHYFFWKLNHAALSVVTAFVILFLKQLSG